ncbi:MAG: 6-bladed beta-propeller [Deltaproteobacteria bacterium]|nr:6-bladed beta-propeller [Deltaproteobacteria bacterium]
MIRFICSFIIFLILSAPSAYGINLLGVTKLFEIRHGFNKPSEVAVSSKGLIYVVDGVNNKIQIFNNNGKFISSFGRKGKENGEFLFPLGIGMDGKDRIYIADSGNHRIQIFNSKGAFLSKIKINSKTRKPADPTDVAVDETRNRIYVVDNDNHKILVYDLTTFTLLKSFGKPGTGKQEFRYPFLLSLDTDKYLYIVDVINTRVQVLNPDGLFVTGIGGWGVEKGQFFRPKGVALDNKNHVFVSDSYTGVIQVFQSTGEFYAAVGDVSTGSVKKFKTPVGLFIDEKKRLFVVEMFANKISVFQIHEMGG